MSTVRFIIAFLNPPLAVALQEGLSWRHWLTLGLTVFGFVPGVVCALVVLFRHEARPFPALRSMPRDACCEK